MDSCEFSVLGVYLDDLYINATERLLLTSRSDLRNSRIYIYFFTSGEENIFIFHENNLKQF